MSDSRFLSPRAWFFVLGACVVSPFVFVLVQGYMADLLVPTLVALGVSSPTGSKIVIASLGVLGALIAAAVLCFPLGWIERRRPAFPGAIVGIVGCIAVSWIWSLGRLDGTVWSVSRILEATCRVYSVFGRWRNRCTPCCRLTSRSTRTPRRRRWRAVRSAPVSLVR